MAEPVKNATQQTPRMQPVSMRVVYAGLAALLIALPWWLNAAAPSWSLTGSVLGGVTIPMLLLIAVHKQIRNWSGITALCMIPCSVVGVMDVIANLDNPLQGLIVAVLAVTVFFAALDAGRRVAAG